MLEPGCFASIHGLATRPEYNGRVVALEGLDADGRWRTRLLGEVGAGLRVRPGNLSAGGPDERRRFLARRRLAQVPLLARALATKLGGDFGLQLGVAGFLAPREALFVCDGRSLQGGSISGDVRFFRRSARKWLTLCKMRESLADSAACALPDGRLLFVGEDCVEVLDALTGCWEPFPSLQCAREGCAATVVGPHVYVCGGGFRELGRMRSRLIQAISVFLEDPDLLEPEDRQLVEMQMARPGLQSLGWPSAVERIDLRSNATRGDAGEWPAPQWESVPAPKGVCLAIFPAIACLGDSLVVAGGSLEDGPTDLCWRYDNASANWEECHLPGARAYSGFCVHKSLGLVLAGGLAEGGEPLATVIAKRHGEDWRALPSLSAPRVRPGLAVVDGSLLVVGGVHHAGDIIMAKGFVEVERFVEAAGKWEVVLDMSYPRTSTACHAFGLSVAHVD